MAAESKPPSQNETLLREVLGLRTELNALVQKVASFEERFASLKASAQAETVKIIAGSVVTCVLAVVGARATQPTPPPTQTIVQRSAFDRALDACRDLGEPAARGECVMRVVSQSANVPAPGDR